MLSSFEYLEISYMKPTRAHGHFHTYLAFSKIIAKPLPPDSEDPDHHRYLCFFELGILSETRVGPSSLNN